ncbi:N-acetylmuramoyl-L-alanine amidase [Nocardia farcinica]|uniref:N-acetylmuramoyl-L-alanine amidase n=2 Tax=Nocardia farcinica TaxID=37329 RepID=A0A0H5NX60_NOCFR|nr:N-acetylmuramoyl-L-alanine amidase [Nocardia farcinica]PFW99058.1 hypothetical protein CJ469_05658 [Nocardia farcinica]PFX06096.1 hypothetical protein CJ468_04956 [Nocardia farcinica]CRY79893.1 N-acetylmuramoyl-L-alanine amidase [Nocardia farcinica]SIT33640.1 N-acetylmuramoyl-L-alanine amidase [Nocardia farcinica]
MSKKDEYALAILAEGRRRGITPRGIVIAFATVYVECDFIMYANEKVPESLRLPHERVGRDGFSVGLFQQQIVRGAGGAYWWADCATCMDPTLSAGLFFERLARLDYNSNEHSPGWYAQAVQRSAYPHRYDERMKDAQALYDRLAGFVPAEKRLPMSKPAFTEIDRMTGGGRSNRTRPPVNFLLHTEEGNSSAEALARYCDGSNGVSYHYTVRDGIVCDVVDTDYASWSVLDANAYTINLCFAGSRASWSRAEWLMRERDIEIAAYLAVQDCRKYGIPTDVIAPPYRRAPGISDHRYVTRVLGIGTHTDVGDGFPWDVFTTYVNKYAGTGESEDELSWGEIIENKEGQKVSREDMIKWIDFRLVRMERMLMAALDQLSGAGVAEAIRDGKAAKFDGFAQGGNRSAYDLQAAIAAKLEVPGTKDMKAA